MRPVNYKDEQAEGEVKAVILRVKAKPGKANANASQC